MHRTLFTALPILLLLLTAEHANGQASPALGSEGQVGAAVSAAIGGTWLSGEGLPTLSVAATLRLSGSVELGGEGVIGLGAIPLDVDGAAGRSELTAGYGGILLRWRPAGDTPGTRWGGSLLVGAGAAKVRSPLAAATVFSDTFFLLEPRLNLLVRQNRPLRFFASAGYRITQSAEGLPGVAVSGLRGPTLAIAAQLVHDP